MSDQLTAAAEQGRTAAVAMEIFRDLTGCGTTYPELFAARPFGPTIFTGMATATAFGSPWASAAELKVAARMALWEFAVDWLVDTAATSRAEIDALVRGCLAVGAGRPPDPAAQVELMLADLRAELTARPTWAAAEPVWRKHLDRYLESGAREWDWKAAGHTPSLAEYLDNADNIGATMVNISHWIYSGSTADLTALGTASDDVQRVIRLLNDLASYQRDLEWGDLNALLLGPTREEIAALTADLTERALTALPGLDAPVEAAYLERQIGFSQGYYGITDYWGER